MFGVRRAAMRLVQTSLRYSVNPTKRTLVAFGSGNGSQHDGGDSMLLATEEPFKAPKNKNQKNEKTKSEPTPCGNRTRAPFLCAGGCPSRAAAGQSRSSQYRRAQRPLPGQPGPTQ